MAASVLATALLIAPVSLHRMLFRRHARRETVQIGHRLAVVGLALLGVAMLGVITLVFAVVLGNRIGLIAATALGIVLVVLWVLLPLRIRTTHTEPAQQPASPHLRRPTTTGDAAGG